MPLDPDRLQLLVERAESLSKRFDAFIERQRAIADDDDDDDDDEDEDGDQLLEPAEAALKETPGIDLNSLFCPDNDEPWWS